MKSLNLVDLDRKNQSHQTTIANSCRKYDGAVPQNIQDLEQLPGVGHKTASVVVSQAFGVPAFPVDTIFIAVLSAGLTNGKNVQQTGKDLKKFFPEEDWNNPYSNYYVC